MGLFYFSVLAAINLRTFGVIFYLFVVAILGASPYVPRRVSRDNEDIERDLAENDGLRPDEQEGPDASEASLRRCEFRQGERSAGVGESSFDADEELHEAFPGEPIPTVMGDDGLPAFIEPNPEDATAVPFTYDTQLCIEDDRTYVEIFHQELRGRGWSHKGASNWCTPSGEELQLVVRSRFNSEGGVLPRAEHKPEDVVHLWGVDLVRLEKSGGRKPVRPLRERCKHLHRQVFSNDSQPDPTSAGHQIVFRVCGARRSNGGAFMSLGNEGIYACDFRDPPDVSRRYLQDAKDRGKLMGRPDLTLLPMFNTPGEAIQLENKS